MKQIILIIAISLLSLTAFCQQKKECVKVSNDTLEIIDYLKVRVIKIGDNYYQIESPTLKKVEQGLYFPNGSGILQLPEHTFVTPATQWYQLDMCNVYGIINDSTSKK